MASSGRLLYVKALYLDDPNDLSVKAQYELPGLLDAGLHDYTKVEVNVTKYL